MNVVLDANALVMPFQYRINIDIELKRLLGDVDIYVPECVIGELKKLSERRRNGKMTHNWRTNFQTTQISNSGEKSIYHLNIHGLGDGHSGGETPGLIPNPAVKPACVLCAYWDARAPGKHGSLSPIL